MVYASVNREVGVVIDALADMGALSAETDHRSLHRALGVLLDKYHGLPIKRFTWGCCREFRISAATTWCRDMLMLLKALSMVRHRASRSGT
jgi:hypothetical protein